ncbi:hypothetical protein [Acetivibrio cellulolyticus]|uniref:hypothetical protein n=1 Tax=Acetivibrio cellulolyticus TaxID=35830 RepID=UPI0001E2C28E|nr:hypothetical protein [Acetivibrio cellulolyticus]
MKEEMNWSGTFIIETKDIKTGNVKTEIVKNKVMDNVLNQLMGTLQGITPNLEIKYLALGTSNTAITTSDTKLGNEIFRTPISSQATGYIGELITDFVVLNNEAVGNIQEIGIFGGITATIVKDTGTLISRILWSKVKTNSEELNFKRIDKIGRG